VRLCTSIWKSALQSPLMSPSTSTRPPTFLIKMQFAGPVMEIVRADKVEGLIAGAFLGVDARKNLSPKLGYKRIPYPLP
jgi:hypothetical protein